MIQHRRVITACAVALAFVQSAALIAQDTTKQKPKFEGTAVAQTAFSKEHSGTVKFTQKWPKQRMDVNNARGHTIIINDLGNGTRTVINPAKKQYWVVSIADRAPELKKAFEEAGYHASGGDVAMEVEATNRSETIAGYPCQWYVLGSDKKVEVCAARDIGQYLPDRSIDGATALEGGAPADTLYDNLGTRFPGGYFPLKMISRESGTEHQVWLVKSIERKKISDSAFEVPKGYTKVDPPKAG